MASNKLSLLPQQQKALEAFQSFCNDNHTRGFILTGYAGTGKTTLLKAFTEWLSKDDYTNATTISKSERTDGSKQFVSLASTGRAAKILSDKIDQIAVTVHSWIYSFQGFNQDITKIAQDIEKNNAVDNTGQLLLNFAFAPLNDCGNKTIYIIDEASMISDTETTNTTQAIFGSGKLLKDLLNYDPNGKYVFVGDDCQLPPINANNSPALQAGYIAAHYHLPVTTATLTNIVRQSSDNDIIVAANRIRKLCINPPYVKWGKFPLKGYSNIKILNSQLDLIAHYVKEVKKNGYNATTLLTGTNKNCTILSKLLRQQLGFTDPRLMVGELLLVTQNNLPTHLMNGDLVKVKSIGNRRQAANLTFLDLEVEEIVTGKVFRTMLIEELLYSNATNLSQHEQKALFIDFYYREKKQNIKENSEQFKKDLMHDPYLNALRAVYGYAITCHKAQGGEWPKVFLDIPRNFSHNPSSSVYQWLYTAITRASNTLYVVNDFFIG